MFFLMEFLAEEICDAGKGEVPCGSPQRSLDASSEGKQWALIQTNLEACSS